MSEETNNDKKENNMPIKEDAGKHYRFQHNITVTKEDLEDGCITLNLDPFRVASIYQMTDFALQTILKKTLCAGNRGHKDFEQDLKDINSVYAVSRSLERIKKSLKPYIKDEWNFLENKVLNSLGERHE